jgi:hypothetical protein
MQMIGQHDERVDRKGMVFARDGNRLAQERDMIDEQGFPSLQQVDGEEPAAARNKRSTIIWHEARDSACRSCAVAETADYAFGSIRPTG